MEEILASIRRIIADDEAAPARRVSTESDAPATSAQIAYAAPALERRETPTAELRHEAPATADIRPLRLATRDAEPSPAEIAAYEQSDNRDYSYDDYADEPVSAIADADPAPPIMSAEVASSIAAHFDTLATTMMINDSGILRKYAQEMMRPMLKQWLDDNLPVIVERLVRAEIERVARGGRR